MGALLSKLPCKVPVMPGLPEQDRIEARIKELISTFTKEYLKAYKSCLIAAIREKSSDATDEKKEKNERQLVFDESKLIPNPQLEGIVLKTKSLDSVDFSISKYWIIDNHYEVREYSAAPTTDEARAKPEKTYNFYQYHVSRGEEKSHYSLELKHDRVSRPQMKIGFVDESIGYKWRGLLELARYRGISPLNPDPVLRKTFPIALNATRWSCSIWSSWYLDGTEAELLSDSFYYILTQEIIQVAFRELSDTPKKMADKTVKKLLDTAITIGWEAIMKGIKPVKDVFEAAVARGLDPIFKTEAKIKGEILSAVSGVVKSALNAVQDKLDEEIEKTYQFLVQAASDEIDLYSDSIRTIISKNGTDSSTVQQQIRHEISENSWYWWGRNRPISNNLYDNVYVANRSGSNSSVYWRLAWGLIEEYRNLNQIALIELGEQLGSTSTDPIARIKELYPIILKKLSHDLHFVTVAGLVAAIDSRVSPLISEHVSPKLDAILSPVQDLIPEDLQDIINPQRTADEIVDELVSGTEEEFVRAALNKLESALETKVQGSAL